MSYRLHIDKNNPNSLEWIWTLHVILIKTVVQ